MRKFDYSFLKRISVPADIMNYATSIYEMKAKAELRRSDFAEVFLRWNLWRRYSR